MKGIPVLGFAAYSGVGKTTIIESVIPGLRACGLRVAVIKHDGHDFEMDHPGKDSWRFAQAGAEVTAICSAEKAAFIERRSLSLGDMLSRIKNVDIILVEGFKNAPITQIGICRSDSGKDFTAPPERFIALVTDREDVPPALPRFSFGETDRLVSFIADNRDSFTHTQELCG